MAEARISVRLGPRAQRDRLLGFPDGVLQARVSAPPVEGRANRALCRMIARRVGVAPSRVSVVHGEKSRDKRLRIEGVDAQAAAKALSE